MRDPNNPQHCEATLATASETWKIYALLNHDLRQIFIGASDAPMARMHYECDSTAKEIEDWNPSHQDIECVEAVETFPTHRHAKAYASWLHREGAFDGAEDYAMGLDSALS